MKQDGSFIFRFVKSIIFCIWISGEVGIIFSLLQETVTAEVSKLDNPANYLPIPDMNTYISPYNKQKSLFSNQSYHSILQQDFYEVQYEAFKRLHYQEPNRKVALKSPLDDILISYPIEPSMAFKVKDKFIVGPATLNRLQEKFILYAAGIAKEPDFEEEMAGHFNVSVFAFDCTIPADTVLKNNVYFHHWCFGRDTDNNFEDNWFSKQSQNRTFVFRSLSETKKILGHHRIHALKMDIEGFEWDILQKDIIDNPNNDDLPDQILIELHAIGARRKYVPYHLTKDKTRRRVNEMVLGMWKRGYRVVFKLANPWDSHCGDFTFLRIHN